jgi:methionine synthase I (cobalamin-dependent)
MRKVMEQQSVESIKEQTQALLRLGFDLLLIESERYILTKLECLNKEQITELKKHF